MRLPIFFFFFFYSSSFLPIISAFYCIDSCGSVFCQNTALQYTRRLLLSPIRIRQQQQQQRYSNRNENRVIIEGNNQRIKYSHYDEIFSSSLHRFPSFHLYSINYNNNFDNEIKTIIKLKDENEEEKNIKDNFPLVVLTREAGKNDKLKAKLEPFSIPTLELPCIAHEEGNDYSTLINELKENISYYDYIIITSPESASVFLKALDAATEKLVHEKEEKKEDKK